MVFFDSIFGEKRLQLVHTKLIRCLSYFDIGPCPFEFMLKKEGKWELGRFLTIMIKILNKIMDNFVLRIYIKKYSRDGKRRFISLMEK